MDVSIIIPVYKVEKYIERCLRSVMSQDFEGDLECILVDDCGPDKSMALAKSLIDNYEGPIKWIVLHHEKNRGLSAARNTGLKKAKGNYVYFLDSDDEITTDCIKVLYALVFRHKGVDMVCGDVYFPSKYKKFHISPNQIEFTDDHVLAKKLLLQTPTPPIMAWNKMVRREFLLKNNLFFKEGLIHEDEIWNWEISKNIQSLAITKNCTYIYYIVEGSIMSSLNERSLQSMIEIFEYICKDIDKKEFELQIAYCYRIGNNALQMCNQFPSEKAIKYKARILKSSQSLRKICYRNLKVRSLIPLINLSSLNLYQNKIVRALIERYVKMFLMH